MSCVKVERVWYNEGKENAKLYSSSLIDAHARLNLTTYKVPSAAAKMMIRPCSLNFPFARQASSSRAAFFEKYRNQV